MEYNTVACGGTFDHLHAGHKAFLRWIFSKADHVLIGLTSDVFAQTEKQSKLQSFEERKKELTAFLQAENFLEKAEIVEIVDVYGPLLNKEITVDALAATSDTYKGAEAINTKRQEIGLPLLHIITMPLKTAITGQTISSSSIREGKMDQDGSLFVKKAWQEANYVLPEAFRHELQKPFGNVLFSLPQSIDSEKTITVGDETTRLFNDAYKSPRLSVVDFIVERAPKYHALEELGFSADVPVVSLANPAGHIVKDAWETVASTLLQEKAVIIVDGEEDLLVLVCILTAPLGFAVYYGQPQKGLVEVQVTLESKAHAYYLMEQFVRI